MRNRARENNCTSHTSNSLIWFVCLPRCRDKSQLEGESEALQDSSYQCPARTVKDCNGTYSGMASGEA